MNRTPRLGDIGPERRYIEFEPLPQTVPVVEPSPEPDREEVPA